MALGQMARIVIALGSFAATFSADPGRSAGCVPLEATDSDRAVIRRRTGDPLNMFDNPEYEKAEFTVPPGEFFDRFEIDVVPEASGEYDIEVQLHYTEDAWYEEDDPLDFYDENIEEFEEDDVELESTEEFNLSVVPQMGDRPYRVSVEVGGFEAFDKSYSVSVSGCHQQP